MIVTCESCKTKFRLDPARLKGPKSKVRCSKCGNVFPVGNPPEFIEEKPKEDLFVQMELPSEEIQTEEDDLLISRSIPAPSVPLQPRKSSPWKTVLVWLVPLIILGIVVVWFFTIKGGSTTSAPDQNAASSPGEMEQPTVSILDSTKAYFLENAHAGQLFVVEGEAVNESSKPVSFILLEGKLYTSNNQVAQDQKSFCGNAMTRDELRQMPIAEIQNRMMNREGKNLSNVHVASGAKIPFMLVFHNLPDLNLLNDYSVEVISAKMD